MFFFLGSENGTETTSDSTKGATSQDQNGNMASNCLVLLEEVYITSCLL